MPNRKELEKLFAARLSMSRRPVAVTFLDTQPEGIEKFSGSEPACCSCWRLAAAGRAFYTVRADHFNCAVGAYTHNVHLPPERVQETEAMLGTMFNLGCVRPEEVPGIPRLPRSPLRSSSRRSGTRRLRPASCSSHAVATRRCSSTKPPAAPGQAARCRCSDGPLVWPFRQRCCTARSPSWAASGIGSTPASGTANSTSLYREQSSNPFPKPWASLQRPTLRSKNSLADVRRRFPQSNPVLSSDGERRMKNPRDSSGL